MILRGCQYCSKFFPVDDSLLYKLNLKPLRCPHCGALLPPRVKIEQSESKEHG